jgi:hypothetical protein
LADVREEVADLTLLGYVEPELENMHHLIASQVGPNLTLELNTDIALILQEITDYHVLDRPSFAVGGILMEWHELARMELSQHATVAEFRNKVFRRLGNKILKAYDARCMEGVSCLKVHLTREFWSNFVLDLSIPLN